MMAEFGDNTALRRANNKKKKPRRFNKPNKFIKTALIYTYCGIVFPAPS